MQTFFLRKSILDGFCSATHDHDGAGNVFEFFHAGKHMSEHRHTGQGLQHFGKRRAHTLALPRGKNNNIDHESIPKIWTPF